VLLLVYIYIISIASRHIYIFKLLGVYYYYYFIILLASIYLYLYLYLYLFIISYTYTYIRPGPCALYSFYYRRKNATRAANPAPPHLDISLEHSTHHDTHTHPHSSVVTQPGRANLSRHTASRAAPRRTSSNTRPPIGPTHDTRRGTRTQHTADAQTAPRRTELQAHKLYFQCRPARRSIPRNLSPPTASNPPTPHRPHPSPPFPFPFPSLPLLIPDLLR
jgi:hypothetical protein